MATREFHLFCRETLELLKDSSQHPVEKLYDLKDLIKAYSLHTLNIVSLSAYARQDPATKEFICFLRLISSPRLESINANVLINHIQNLCYAVLNNNTPPQFFCKELSRQLSDLVEIHITQADPQLIEGILVSDPSTKIKIVPSQLIRTYDFPYPLSKNTLVRFFNLIKKDNRTYVFDSTSLAVLNPDFLIDITMVLYNPYRSLIDALLPSEPSVPLIRGAMINEIIDSLIINPNDEQHAIKRAILKYPLSLCLLFGNNPNSLKELINEINLQIPHIKRFVSNHLTDGTILTETNVLSPQFGLQGRIDCYQQSPEKHTIYEFKSGKEREADHNQVGLYQLLSESNAPKGLQGTLFYSSSGKIIKLTQNIGLKRLLDNRNKIVFLLTLLARRQTNRFINELKRFKERISYTDESLELFLKTLENASDTQREYYFELLGFLVREYFFTKREAQSVLWKASQWEKAHNNSIIRNLRFIAYDKQTNQLTFEHDGSSHFFREGDPVYLYPDSSDTQPHQNLLISCIIREVSANRLIISPFNRQKSIEEVIKTHERWAVEGNLIDKQFWDGFKALFTVISHQSQTSKVLINDETPNSPSNQPNQIQNVSPIQKALQSNDYFLLQGPPGSGKTSTFLIGYVKELLRRDVVPTIFILAFTNKAVQNICSKLQLNQIPYIRFGSKYTLDQWFFNQIAHDTYTHDVNKESEILQNVSSWHKRLQRTRVVVSTIASFKSHLTEFARLFDLANSELIIDEASQVTEADIAGILPLFRKFVLIGDHKQLPPVIVQPPHALTVRNPSLNKIGLTSHNISLFERLMTQCIKVGDTTHFDQLQHHYRVHKEIADLYRHHYLKP
ncbi:MAG: AAA family ATPase, partial [Chlorobi bacterium]|nr:AAA family ATPase [Chlorobiota bacterium]